MGGRAVPGYREKDGRNGRRRDKEGERVSRRSGGKRERAVVYGRKEGAQAGGGSVLWYPTKHLALLSGCPVFSPVPRAYRSSSYYPKLHWHPLGLPLGYAEGASLRVKRLVTAPPIAGRNIYIRSEETGIGQHRLHRSRCCCIGPRNRVWSPPHTPRPSSGNDSFFGILSPRSGDPRCSIERSSFQEERTIREDELREDIEHRIPKLR